MLPPLLHKFHDISCETDTGGGDYGRNSIIYNYQTTIHWISKCNYHKRCLGYCASNNIK